MSIGTQPDVKKKVNWFSSLSEKYKKIIATKIHQNEGNLDINQGISQKDHHNTYYQVMIQDGALYNKNTRILQNRTKKGLPEINDQKNPQAKLEVSPRLNLNSISPTNEEYLNFMGRVQGGKIRSQSAANLRKKQIHDQKPKRSNNIIEIPVMNSFDKKMSLSTLKNEGNYSEDPTFEEKEPSKNYTMKYVGVTFGKIGILSQKVPLESAPKIEKVKYNAPKPPQKRNSTEIDPPPKLKVEECKKPPKIFKPKPKVKLSKFKNKRKLAKTKEVALENSFKTPSREIRDPDETNSPLQGMVSRPVEGDNGTPKMINFDFDTLSQHDYFETKRNSGSSPVVNMAPKLAKAKVTSQNLDILQEKKKIRRKYKSSKSQKFLKKSKIIKKVSKKVLRDEDKPDPKEDPSAQKENNKDISNKAIKIKKKISSNKQSFSKQKPKKLVSHKIEERTSAAETSKKRESMQEQTMRIAQHEFLNQSKSSSNILMSEDRTFNFLKKKDNYLVNNYALPRGLNSCQRIPVLSDSERFFDNRYSKQAIGELKIKDCFTILGKTSDIIGFRGCKPCKTSQGVRRKPNSKISNFQTARHLRPKTMRDARSCKNLNIQIGTEQYDKNGRDLHPDFSITPSKSLASTKNLGVSSKMVSPINYPEGENKDIQEVKNLMNKYKTNKLVTHKYVEDTELHENLPSTENTPVRDAKEESTETQSKFTNTGSPSKISQKASLFKNRGIYGCIDNKFKTPNENIFENPFVQKEQPQRHYRRTLRQLDKKLKLPAELDQSHPPRPEDELYIKFVQFKQSKTHRE
ncbi:unnamed protein product [Moneuplotes crassus]|uniref:Uncharacterized protein n=1 Tax=Euplotes crassus TaxID=5936 RepID=A0AAD1XXQ5_EUPCR|nr:unnamed protein product [Moneuplotes crassus]